MHVNDCITNLRYQVNGRWEAFGFSLGETIWSDSIQLSVAELANETKRRGKVDIYVQRGKMYAAYSTSATDWASEETRPDCMPPKTIRTVAIDHGRSHSFRYVHVRVKRIRSRLTVNSDQHH